MKTETVLPWVKAIVAVSALSMGCSTEVEAIGASEGQVTATETFLTKANVGLVTSKGNLLMHGPFELPVSIENPRRLAALRKNLGLGKSLNTLKPVSGDHSYDFESGGRCFGENAQFLVGFEDMTREYDDHEVKLEIAFGCKDEPKLPKSGRVKGYLRESITADSKIYHIESSDIAELRKFETAPATLGDLINGAHLVKFEVRNRTDGGPSHFGTAALTDIKSILGAFNLDEVPTVKKVDAEDVPTCKGPTRVVTFSRYTDAEERLGTYYLPCDKKSGKGNAWQLVFDKDSIFTSSVKVDVGPLLGVATDLEKWLNK